MMFILTALMDPSLTRLKVIKDYVKTAVILIWTSGELFILLYILIQWFQRKLKMEVALFKILEFVVDLTNSISAEIPNLLAKVSPMDWMILGAGIIVLLTLIGSSGGTVILAILSIELLSIVSSLMVANDDREDPDPYIV